MERRLLLFTSSDSAQQFERKYKDSDAAFGFDNLQRLPYRRTGISWSSVPWRRLDDIRVMHGESSIKHFRI